MTTRDTTVELHNLMRGARFKVVEPLDTTIPPAALMPEAQTVYKKLNNDGMYCNCLEEQSGTRMYFALWTKVEEVANG